MRNLRIIDIDNRAFIRAATAALHWLRERYPEAELPPFDEKSDLVAALMQSACRVKSRARTVLWSSDVIAAVAAATRSAFPAAADEALARVRQYVVAG